MPTGQIPQQILMHDSSKTQSDATMVCPLSPKLIFIHNKSPPKKYWQKRQKMFYQKSPTVKVSPN